MVGSFKAKPQNKKTPSVSIQRRQNKWTDLCFHHKCYYICSWERMHPSCILFHSIWIKGNNVLCNTQSEPHLSPLLFGRTRPIIDQINLKELADTLWMKQARSYKHTHLHSHSIATVEPVKSASVLLPEALAGFMGNGRWWHMSGYCAPSDLSLFLALSPPSCAKAKQAGGTLHLMEL